MKIDIQDVIIDQNNPNMASGASNEQANLNLLGQTLQLFLKSGAVKIFLYLLIVVAATTFGFSFKISPMLPFLVFVAFCIWLFNYLFKLLPKRPELFQDSQTWLGHQRLLIGDKQRGLYELPPKTQLVQPIVQTKTIDAKANIRKSKTT